MVLRQRVWIDKSVQGVLIGRVALYWIVTLVYVGLGCVCFQYYQQPGWTIADHSSALFAQFWPWLPSAILFLPLVIFDVVRLSNLFVGPIYRLRAHLAELVENPACQPLKFREDDYWQDLAEPIHFLQSEILLLRSELNNLRKSQKPTTQTELQKIAAGSIPAESRPILPDIGLQADPVT